MAFYFQRNEDKKADELAGQWEKLPREERLFAEALELTPAAGGFVLLQIDMEAALGRFKDRKTTPYLELLIKAISLAFERHPNLYKLAVGDKRYYLSELKVGLSVAGETFLAPLAILKKAHQKSIPELSQDILVQGVAARRRDERDRALLHRWAWLVPFSFLRRLLQRLMMNRLRLHDMGPGVVQVTHVPNVDVVTGFRFVATALFAVGALRERVIAVNGQPVVRPTVWLSCAADHAVWDGMCIAVIMSEIKKILELEPDVL